MQGQLYKQKGFEKFTHLVFFDYFRENTWPLIFLAAQKV
jgi:hypothetical protein